MSMLQLKNVPEPVKRALRKRAREEGLSMSDYVLRLITRELDRPTPEELLKRLEALGPTTGTLSGAELVEEARREREAELGF